MLTHVIQSEGVSLFLIDEPDIYLHADLQRQLLGLLRNLGPDILLATHSTEIITEAEPDDIILINKRRSSARRIKHPSELMEVFALLGSNLNPILTQLAKTKRVLFVEGKDFQVLGRFATKLGHIAVGARSDFAVVPVDGFNPDRIRSLKHGMETTLGGKIKAAAILDRDFRSDKERASIESSCRIFCDMARVLDRKEIENYLLIPAAIDRAAAVRVADRSRRTGRQMAYEPQSEEILTTFAEDKRNYVVAQTLANHRRFERIESPGTDETVVSEAALAGFEMNWQTLSGRLCLIPGKDALSAVNQKLQQLYAVSVTPTGIIDSINRDEIPQDLRSLIDELAKFARIKSE